MGLKTKGPPFELMQCSKLFELLADPTVSRSPPLDRIKSCLDCIKEDHGTPPGQSIVQASPGSTLRTNRSRLDELRAFAGSGKGRDAFTEAGGMDALKALCEVGKCGQHAELLSKLVKNLL